MKEDYAINKLKFSGCRYKKYNVCHLIELAVEYRLTFSQEYYGNQSIYCGYQSIYCGYQSIYYLS
jgi:hypothetical protein